jgi:hypothetical protein
MENEQLKNGISRRELMQSLTALGLLGVSSTMLAGPASAANSVNPLHRDTVNKVLIERLVNTHFYQDSDGNVIVLLKDEIWPGDEGSAYHQDWLFNPDYGLKENPRAALEDTIETDIEHSGIPQGSDIENIGEILEISKRLGLLDDANLLYQVLREKIHVETHGALDEGVRQFLDWVNELTDLTEEQRNNISGAAVRYLSLARPQENHNFY